MVAHVRPDARRVLRCPRCDLRCGRYDGGDGRRRWRTLDLGTLRCLPEGDAPRVRCPGHGVLVTAVPWATPRRPVHHGLRGHSGLAGGPRTVSPR